ncbi:MAG: 50S ribosomal protein L9 [Treponema sp.]|nr:50S ribosomal protein L9 [Treponema sp.]
MKVILNVDIKSLGEEGDVKNVARGYYRNYLHPRNMAVLYTPETAAIFEGRRAEIEARKAQKRKDAAGVKERLESLALEVSLPSGPNGKLYGAVTAPMVVDLLQKEGFTVERKRVEIPGVTIKSVGTYHVTVKLYESATADVKISVKAQTDERSAAADKKASPSVEPHAADAVSEEAPSATDDSVAGSTDAVAGEQAE